MPSVAELKPSVDSFKSLLPLTHPVPTPLTHPELITTKDLVREEDLLRNPSSFRHWWTAIQTARDAFATLQKAENIDTISPEVTSLLGPLSTPIARLCLQRLTYLYENALAQFPGSFKLWKSYLHMRMSYVLGKFVQKRRAGGRKKFPEMKDALEDEKEDLEDWDGGLDAIVGYEEWRLLVATFERALMWLPNVCLVTSTQKNNPLTKFFAAAPTLAALPFHFLAPQMPCRLFAYPCTENLRSCISYSSAFSAFAYLGPLFTVGGSERWIHDSRSVPTISHR